MKNFSEDAPVRIFLVDDHPIMREGLAMLLNNQPGMAVAGQAGSADEALRTMADTEVDLVILDLNLGETGGLDLLPHLRDRFPEIIVLVLSMHDDPESVRAAMSFGAAGFVRKQDAGDLLLQAIRQVVAGEIFLPRNLAEKLFLSDRPTAATELEGRCTLTPREREILFLIGEGRSPAEIAKALSISPRTVDAHQANLKRKLGVTSTRELIRLAPKISRTERS